MHRALARNVFLVKEHVGIFKAANNYDILDPQSGELVLECREDKLGLITKALRFTDYKREHAIRYPGSRAQWRADRAYHPRHFDLPLEG